MTYLPLNDADRQSAIDRTAAKVNGGKPRLPGNPTKCGRCGTITAPLYVSGPGGYWLCDYCDAELPA